MASTETARCSGHCCRVFWLPMRAEDIAEGIASCERVLADPAMDAGQIAKARDNREIAMMAVHLAPTREELSPDLQAILGPPHDHHGKKLPVGGWYTCKNLDVETGDCLIYEERPYMCRDHPYDRKQGCQYPGCTRKCEDIDEAARNPDGTYMESPARNNWGADR